MIAVMRDGCLSILGLVLHHVNMAYTKLVVVTDTTDHIVLTVYYTSVHIASKFVCNVKRDWVQLVQTNYYLEC